MLHSKVGLCCYLFSFYKLRSFVFFIIFIRVLSSDAIACGDSVTSTIVKHKKTEVQLAEVFSIQQVNNYLVSEKYDGIRAIYQNGELRTRNGNLISAPNWFLKGLPNIWLDGELWIARNSFEQVASIVSKNQANESDWQLVKYMVFDAPDYLHSFDERSDNYTKVLLSLNLPHVIPVIQTRLKDRNQLLSLLEQYTNKGAEGLMLHHADAMFASGRTGNLLKLKTYMDAEAEVLAYTQGKGKYANAIGALVVKYKTLQGNFIQFKVGTGLSDAMRKTPPPIGSIITFKYHGFTASGVPRFASFLRLASKPSKQLKYAKSKAVDDSIRRSIE